MVVTGLIAGVASLEEDNYVVFYYLTASEICPDKRGGLMALEQEWPVLRGTIT